MMGTDEFAEPKKANHTPTIALAVAAVLLLIVGAMSYRDFVRDSVEKEFAEKQGQQPGYQVMGQPGMVQPMYQPGIVQYQPVVPQGYVVTQPTVVGPNGQPMVAAPGQVYIQPGATPTGTPSTVAPPPIPESTAEAIQEDLPEPEDPELDRMRASIAEAAEQARRTEEQYNAITSDLDGQSETAEITEELPEFLRNALENPPGGNPDVEARTERLREQVVRSPSLGQVTSFNPEWNVVTFDAGAAQGVAKGQRFAVRRGGDIVGWIKVDEVDASESIGYLVTKNRNSETAVKPAPGDQLINFEVF
ncbi:MAG: hypothetical protein AAF236_14790 [Verrucomicrobiota bacterium]